MKSLVIALAVAAPLIGNPAWASSLTISGDTGSATAPQNNFGFAYESQLFQVSAAGNYDFKGLAGYTNYILLYQGNFDPSSSYQNLLADAVGQWNGQVYVADFSQYLNAGTRYEFINSSINAAETGPFIASITGPGNITAIASPVPEPASMAMLISGLGLIGAARKRIRRDDSIRSPAVENKPHA